jgi:hypothetical protein
MPALEATARSQFDRSERGPYDVPDGETTGGAGARPDGAL